MNGICDLLHIENGGTKLRLPMSTKKEVPTNSMWILCLAGESNIPVEGGYMVKAIAGIFPMTFGLLI